MKCKLKYGTYLPVVGTRPGIVERFEAGAEFYRTIPVPNGLHLSAWKDGEIGTKTYFISRTRYHELFEDARVSR